MPYACALPPLRPTDLSVLKTSLSQIGANTFSGHSLGLQLVYGLASTFTDTSLVELVFKTSTQFITWFAVVAEMLVILASQNPSNTISKMILTALMLNGRHVCKIHISSLSILGSTLVAVGTYTRIRCYHTLGRMFTFELCLRDDHQLIMDGPYAVLRHPSYAGLIMTIIGACCSHASGSWVGECGVKEYTLGRVLMLYWMVVAGSVIASLVLRIPREEEILRRRFGEQWENWAQEVRYRLVPGVY